jgi:hypothetical protein
MGGFLVANDSLTSTRVPHRELMEADGKRPAIVKSIRKMLVRHHISPEAMKRDRQQREAMARLGFAAQQERLRRFPTSSKTRKGNLAEVVLAEYIVAASGADLPVYRLRYNPNVDQSMKGDDVLAFDLDADPVRIIVGEAKFRAASTTAAVTDIVDSLLRSHKGGIPVSLQFIADRLFDSAQADLGARIMECAKLFALGKLRLDYVGMLLSDTRSAERVDQAAPNSLRRLVMISLGIETPSALVDACYEDLEET